MADLKLVRRHDFTSLRNRIAKVLHQRFGPSLGAAQCGWDREPKATKDMYREDADAVIAELGLRREGTDPEQIIGHGYPPMYRYVTDWKADDE